MAQRFAFAASGLAASLSLAVPAGADCPADVTGDGRVDAEDLAGLLGGWGPCKSCGLDLDGDGQVASSDLTLMLGGWGACPPAWATVLEHAPDPAVVRNPALRGAIVATGLPWRVRDDASQIELLLVPPGEFMMGCSRSLQSNCVVWESPVHHVTITQPYYLARHEVTQAQWTAVMGSNPSMRQNAPDAGLRPVEMVSWEMIQGFTAATGLRLPTEAEWELAYRAGTTTAFHSMSEHHQGTDDETEVSRIGWWSGNSFGKSSGPRPVGTKEANDLGLHDMAGNIFEWVGDWYELYPSEPDVDPSGPMFGTARVMRGGSWANPRSNLRASFRIYAPPGWSFEWVGFRVARSP